MNGKGGDVAGKEKRDMEEKTGKWVVSHDNYLSTPQKAKNKRGPKAVKKNQEGSRMLKSDGLKGIMRHMKEMINLEGSIQKSFRGARLFCACVA